MNNKNYISEEAFEELVNGLEFIESFTLYGRKSLKYHIKRLQEENQQLKKQLEEKDRIIKKAKKIIKNRINDISKLKLKLYPKGYYDLLKILNIDKGE